MFWIFILVVISIVSILLNAYYSFLFIREIYTKTALKVDFYFRDFNSFSFCNKIEKIIDYKWKGKFYKKPHPKGYGEKHRLKANLFGVLFIIFFLLSIWMAALI